MVELDQFKSELAGYREPLDEVTASLGLDDKKAKIEELEREMEAPGFWDDPDTSNAKMKDLKNMKDIVQTVDDLRSRYEDIETLIGKKNEEYQRNDFIEYDGHRRPPLRSHHSRPHD